MCNKKSPPPPLPLPSCHGDRVRRSSRIHNKVKLEDVDEEEEDDEITLESLRRAARKSRTRTRKPKYLSLRSQQLISQDRQQKYRTLSAMTSAKGSSHRQQLNLFPLHPENLVDHQEKVDMQEDNVALLFNSDGGGATLNDLLTSNSTATTVTTTTTTSTTMSSDKEEYGESFSTYAYYNDIVRTAMRSREREMSVEKWVCFSELVDKKEDCFTTSSTSTSSHRATHADDDDDQLHQRWRSKVKGEGLGLALKLDYQEILNVWSDKGPLYVDGGDAPQTVPDLLHQNHQLFQLHDNTPNVRNYPF